MDPTFSNALMKWMDDHVMTVRTMAEKFDVEPGAVKKWLAGKNMCLKNKTKIFKMTGIDYYNPETWVFALVECNTDDDVKQEPVVCHTVELEGIYMTEGDCPDCCMAWASCAILKDLLGAKCGNQNGLIFVRESKEQWALCSRGNTKVGSVVRCIGDQIPLLTVNHIIDDNLFLLEADIGEYDVFNMNEFEVKVGE